MAIKIALAGNPNCGKTTMFNALTGANQYVGNWPGVTVEKKEGKLKSKSQSEEVIVTLCVYQIGSFLFYGSFGAGTVVAFVVLLFMLYMLFRPDPYKDQKTYSKRSVQSASL